MKSDIYKNSRDSGGKSTKTGLKVPLNKYDHDHDQDHGPDRINSKHIKRNRLQRVKDSPLHRFIEKSKGRPWDKVYSELKKCFGKYNKALNDFIWRIERDVVIKNGVPHSLNGHIYQGFYVHPNGLLMHHKQKLRKERQPVEKIVLGSNHYRLVTIEGPADKCGCQYNTFRLRHGGEKVTCSDDGRPFELTCPHGNPAALRKIWYVVEDVYHAPDEIYCTEYLEGRNHHTYYRDVPEKNHARERLVKVCNKKELRDINAVLTK